MKELIGYELYVVMKDLAKLSEHILGYVGGNGAVVQKPEHVLGYVGWNGAVVQKPEHVLGYVHWNEAVVQGIEEGGWLEVDGVTME